MTGFNNKKNAEEQAVHFLEGGVASEAFPWETTADGSKVIKWVAGDMRGHISTDQTVAFHMETTCGQHADQREFENLPALYIFI